MGALATAPMKTAAVLDDPAMATLAVAAQH